MNLPIEQINELAKSYFAYRTVGASEADSILKKLNQLRINLVAEAEMRRVFWDEVQIKQLASDARQNIFYSRNDVDYLLKRGIAYLESDVLVSLEKRSGTVRRFTRESTAWQSIFSYVQNTGVPLGTETLLDFPQELRFGANESLNFGITRQNTQAGKLFLHGATMENNFDLNMKALQEEVAISIPQTQFIPIRFQFNTVNGDAVDVNGNNQILSDKASRSVLITHVSTNYLKCKVSLYDEGKNLQFCDRVEMAGVAGYASNQYQNWYELPYPHVLYKGDRIKLRATNGSDIYDDPETGSLLSLVFKGITI